MPVLPAATRNYPRTHPVRPARLRRRVLTLTGLGLAGLLVGLLSGCSTTLSGSTAASTSSTASYAQLTGNWRVSTSAATATTTQLTALGGTLSASGSDVSGLLHALTPGQCLAPAETLAVTGSITPAGILTLTGQTAAHTTVTLSGTIAPDRQTLTNPTLSATGGRCTTTSASVQTNSPHPEDSTGSTTTAQQYQPVSGTYTGTFTTAGGDSFPLTTTVTQLDQPDASGLYHLQGSAASTGNPCLPGSVTATASTLSGGNLSATYTDATGATTITATGSASPDGTTLVITQWQITSACGSDTGTGSLTRQ